MWPGLAIVILCALILGTAVFGILWAAFAGLVSLVRDLLTRVSRRPGSLPRPGPRSALPTATTDPTTEALWQRMQGTSKRSRIGPKSPSP